MSETRWGLGRGRGRAEVLSAGVLPSDGRISHPLWRLSSHEGFCAPPHLSAAFPRHHHAPTSILGKGPALEVCDVFSAPRTVTGWCPSPRAGGPREGFAPRAVTPLSWQRCSRVSSAEGAGRLGQAPSRSRRGRRDICGDGFGRKSEAT